MRKSHFIYEPINNIIQNNINNSYKFTNDKSLISNIQISNINFINNNINNNNNIYISYDLDYNKKTHYNNTSLKYIINDNSINYSTQDSLSSISYTILK